MRDVLAICRSYGRDLDWWTGLDTATQALLQADWRMVQDEEAKRWKALTTRRS